MGSGNINGPLTGDVMDAGPVGCDEQQQPSNTQTEANNLLMSRTNTPPVNNDNVVQNVGGNPVLDLSTPILGLANFGQTVTSLATNIANLSINAYNNSRINAYGNPGINTYDYPRSNAYGNAGINTYGNPGINAYGNPGINAYDCPRINAYDNPNTGFSAAPLPAEVPQCADVPPPNIPMDTPQIPCGSPPPQETSGGPDELEPPKLDTDGQGAPASLNIDGVDKNGNGVATLKYDQGDQIQRVLTYANGKVTQIAETSRACGNPTTTYKLDPATGLFKDESGATAGIIDPNIDSNGQYTFKTTDLQNNPAGSTNFHIVDKCGNQVDTDIASPVNGGPTPEGVQSKVGDLTVKGTKDGAPGYNVVKGDSIWKTADTILGMDIKNEDPKKVLTAVKAIEAANPDIKDPDLIYSGQTLIIPVLPSDLFSPTASR